MIFIKKPPVLRFRKRAWLRRQLKEIDLSKDPQDRSARIDVLAKIPQAVTAKLVAHFGNKCWYCERILPSSELVIEHFRPKRRVTGLKNHPGYFWLAANSKNFRIACKNCNCRWTNPNGVVAGKGNYFPLLNEVDRVSTRVVDLRSEIPLLYDPLRQSDCEGLIFIADGSCLPAADDYIEVSRGFSSINLYNLNNPVLVDSRKRLWGDIELLANLAGRLKSSDPDCYNEAIERIRTKAKDHSEYAGLVRSQVRQLNNISGFSI
jgi:5-methylcytosine-specific restriction endonuclease McrA